MSPPVEPLMLTMDETAQLLRVSLRQIKKMVAAGDITSVKLGRRRLIPYEVLKRDVLAQVG
jgi:excisionase family DNA binding protein